MPSKSELLLLRVHVVKKRREMRRKARGIQNCAYTVVLPYYYIPHNRRHLLRIEEIIALCSKNLNVFEAPGSATIILHLPQT